MPSAAPDHAFVAPVLRQETGMRFHYLPVPDDVADALQAAGNRRVIATLNGLDVRRALQSGGDGERMIVLGQAILRDVGAGYGETVTVALRPDPAPDDIDLGEELAAVLDQDAAAAERFFGMTPGRQRSLAYYVTSARRVETRIARALDVAHKLRTRTLYGDR